MAQSYFLRNKNPAESKYGKLDRSVEAKVLQKNRKWKWIH